MKLNKIEIQVFYLLFASIGTPQTKILQLTEVYIGTKTWKHEG